MVVHNIYLAEYGMELIVLMESAISTYLYEMDCEQVYELHILSVHGSIHLPILEL